MADWIAISADEFPRSGYRIACSVEIIPVIELREFNGKRLKLAGNLRL
jgi:hypothetical protein